MTTPSISDLSALREVAEKATPGPWNASGGYLTVRDPERGSFTMSIYHLNEMGQVSREAPFQAVPFSRQEDAAFIAAFNPQTAIALLEALAAEKARADAAEAERDEARKAKETWKQTAVNMDAKFASLTVKLEPSPICRTGDLS